ncbi:MAG: helix-turn-helix domain-containing protein [Nitrospinota bacterium]|nr:helix-turn-helix domain-containing protein [Nitrospinota bacterium]
MTPDWHWADVKSGLEKRGTNLTVLAKKNGISLQALAGAARKRAPRMQSIIAKALGVHPSIIWPSRYHNNGQPIRYKVGRKPKGSPTNANSTMPRKSGKQGKRGK